MTHSESNDSYTMYKRRSTAYACFRYYRFNFLSVISWDAFLKIKVMKRIQRNKTLFSYLLDKPLQTVQSSEIT